MHKNQILLQGLYNIGLHRVFQKHRHGTDRMKIFRSNRFSFLVIRYDDSGKTGFQIRKVLTEAENGHNLRRHGDDEVVFSYYSVLCSAKTDNDVSKRSVIHIEAALPLDSLQINVQCISLLNMIIEHCGKQIVCRSNRMEISREMKIQILHRNHLGISSSGCTALDSEAGSETRLPEGGNRFLSDTVQSIG